MAKKPKKIKGPTADLILWGEIPRWLRMPRPVLFRYLKTAGLSYRMPPPLAQLFGIGGAGLLTLTMGYYSWLFYHGSVVNILMWTVPTALLGGVVGWMLGTAFVRNWLTYLYTSWSEWTVDANEGTPLRELTPIEYSGCELSLTPRQKLAIAIRSGEIAPPRSRRDSATSPMDPRKIMPGISDADLEGNPLMQHVSATFTTKGLHTGLQAKVPLRVLSKSQGSRKIFEYASIGSIAVSILVIAALVTLVFTQDTGGGGSAPKGPAPGQAASNVK